MDNFNSLGAREGGKNALKRVKKNKNKVFVKYKYQSATHVFACIFSRAFQSYRF